MLITIARHAWAYGFGDQRWPDDAQRPLEKEGIERYTRVVQSLADRGFAPDVIATSPYLRCRQTAEIISRYTERQPAVEGLNALLPGSNFADLLAWSQRKNCEQICWVGHVPDVSHLTAALIGDQQASIRFAKGTIAAVKYDGDLGEGYGELVWLATAKSLGC